MTVGETPSLIILTDPSRLAKRRDGVRYASSITEVLANWDPRATVIAPLDKHGCELVYYCWKHRPGSRVILYLPAGKGRPGREPIDSDCLLAAHLYGADIIREQDIPATLEAELKPRESQPINRVHPAIPERLKDQSAVIASRGSDRIAPWGDSRFPGYTVVLRVGAGTFGEVWLVRDLLGHHRCIKVLYKRHEATELKALERYCETWNRHPGLIRVLHLNQHNGRTYYVMLAADDCRFGRRIHPLNYRPHTLQETFHTIRLRGVLPVREIIQIGLELLNALEHLHASNLVHRDVKLENCLIIEGRLQLGDIGLVQPIDGRTQRVGTPGYIPPEGHGRPTGDIYSLGVLLYTLLTGMSPGRFPRLPTQMSQEARQFFSSIILKACLPDFRQRFQSCAAMKAALRSV